MTRTVEVANPSTHFTASGKPLTNSTTSGRLVCCPSDTVNWFTASQSLLSGDWKSIKRAGAPAIVLIMGLGTQMTAWSDPFCDALAAGGYQVIRFDNRDVGLSSKIEGGRPVNMKWAFLKAMLGLKVQGPYTLDEMAADGLALMDHLIGSGSCPETDSAEADNTVSNTARNRRRRHILLHGRGC